MQLEVVHDGQVVRLARAGSLAIQHFHAPPGVPALDAIEAMQTTLVTQHPRISTLTVLDLAALVRPDAATRDRSVAVAAKFEGHMRRAAIVLEARGLVAMMVRTFLATFLVFSSTSTPNRVFASLGEALTWLQDDAEGTFAALTEGDVQRFLDARVNQTP